ncbi:MAG: hypothetical protein HYU38_00010 [Candidatus Tectomicrobia bacterium]|nr:hypothetical protein [Candidatus Tectomicrobia bacterium]
MAAVTLRGTLKAFDAATYKATVQVTGSVPTWLQGVRVSRGIPAVEMVAGRACAILFPDPANPDEAVVVAVYT